MYLSRSIIYLVKKYNRNLLDLINSHAEIRFNPIHYLSIEFSRIGNSCC